MIILKTYCRKKVDNRVNEKNIMKEEPDSEENILIEEIRQQI